ncbi:MAG: PilZ domain-containing protein [Alkalimonas sp.]|uniref:PilZ domain-containing protein n=1 Tax=Alkalimonas delamerensis TaxID=265981 RepID=A0ABT9GQ51_9GAMM|nr:PilZ domain-containing protein [Alkalimonas delamerensis]MCC5851573.1 PilZ domain-containing protein [Alkalimonas sp.]MDP4528910.1 PilZ domain-containing protein [Alkalimonas delamerensis]
MEEIPLDFMDVKELYRCYMSFLKQGGLFVRTAKTYKMGQSLALNVTLPDALEPLLVSGKVAWITPHGAQNSSPAGVGVAFIDDKHHLNDQIIKLVAGLQASNEITYTL